jgi:hypothetical protein
MHHPARAGAVDGVNAPESAAVHDLLALLELDIILALVALHGLDARCLQQLMDFDGLGHVGRHGLLISDQLDAVVDPKLDQRQSYGWRGAEAEGVRLSRGEHRCCIVERIGISAQRRRVGDATFINIGYPHDLEARVLMEYIGVDLAALAQPGDCYGVDLRHWKPPVIS